MSLLWSSARRRAVPLAGGWPAGPPPLAVSAGNRTRGSPINKTALETKVRSLLHVYVLLELPVANDEGYQF